MHEIAELSFATVHLSSSLCLQWRALFEGRCCFCSCTFFCLSMRAARSIPSHPKNLKPSRTPSRLGESNTVPTDSGATTDWWTSTSTTSTLTMRSTSTCSAWQVTTFFPAKRESIRFANFCADEYEGASAEVIGQSYEGRDMVVLKFCEAQCGENPIMWIDGGAVNFKLRN